MRIEAPNAREEPSGRSAITAQTAPPATNAGEGRACKGGGLVLFEGQPEDDEPDGVVSRSTKIGRRRQVSRLTGSSQGLFSEPIRNCTRFAGSYSGWSTGQVASHPKTNE